MDLKENKHRVYLYQFSNIVLGTSVLALLLSINAAFAQISNWPTRAVVFVFTFFAIFHGWWRNSELYTTSKVHSNWVYLIGLGRIVLLLLSVLWLQALPLATGMSMSLAIFFGLIALASWTGWVQQIHFIRPLYGKARIMQRREFLADLFYAVSLTLFVVGLIFAPQYVFGLIGFGVLAVLILIGRPIAKTATPWTEPEPPHRGGRRPRRTDERRDHRPNRDSRPRTQRTYGQRSPHRSGRDDSDQRQERREPRQRRSTPHSADTRQYDQRPDKMADTISDENSSHNNRPRQRSSQGRRPAQRSSHKPRSQEQKTQLVESQNSRPSPQSGNTDQKDLQQQAAFGRKRRSKKSDAKYLDDAPAQEQADKNTDSAKSSEAVNSTNQLTADQVAYGRRRVKSRAKSAQIDENSASTSNDPDSGDKKSKPSTEQGES